MNLPKRKPTRLANFDYSTNGTYFITICTYNRKRFFGNIVGQGLAPAENRLSIYGKIAEEQLLLLENRYQNIKIDKYVIMPNHIHIIILINKTAGASPCPTISSIMCTYKSLTSRICRQNGLKSKLFQSSFYDHIIRNEQDYNEIWQYIEANPQKWSEDRFYSTDKKAKPSTER